MHTFFFLFSFLWHDSYKVKMWRTNMENGVEHVRTIYGVRSTKYNVPPRQVSSGIHVNSVEWLFLGVIITGNI